MDGEMTSACSDGNTSKHQEIDCAAESALVQHHQALHRMPRHDFMKEISGKLTLSKKTRLTRTSPKYFLLTMTSTRYKSKEIDI